MTAPLSSIANLHRRFFMALERALDGWFLGLAARFVFAAVLWGYFLASARTKVGDGVAGFFSITDGAYYQIALPAVEAANYDITAVPFFPWGFLVTLGTYGEFLLPPLIVAGLFARIAAAGMIGFIAVQTLVDITVHKVGAETIGVWFDRMPDSAVADQRLLWVLPLAIIVVKGAGYLSLDHLLGRSAALRQTTPAAPA